MNAAPKVPHARDLPGVTTIITAPPENCLCRACFSSFPRGEMANKGRDRKGREREPTECKRCYNERKRRSYDPKKKRRSPAATTRSAEARVRFAIAHAAWLPDRRRTLARLMEQLGENVLVSVSPGPEHAAIWARRLWEAAARTFPHEHVCFLNDDVLVHPELRRIVEAMIEAVPDEPLSLHTNVLGAAAEAMKGHRWARCYWYTGPAVVLSPADVRSLLAWVYRTPWSFLSRNNEDNCAIHWSWAEQRPFWCAIPAPVIHDTATPSTLGYDNHPWRVPTVPWSAPEFAGAVLTDPARWRVEAPPPWVPNPWMPTERLELVRRVLAEQGARLCSTCQAQAGVVGAGETHLCRRCLMTLYGAAVSRGQEER